MFRPVTLLSLFLALALTTSAKANDYAADCAGWSVSSDKIIDDQETYILVEVKLFVLEDGEYVATGIEESECVIVPSKFTPWEVSGDWGTNLAPGDYKAEIVNSQYCTGDHSGFDLDCEVPEGWPCYQPTREITFTCEGGSVGDDDDDDDDDDDCTRRCCKKGDNCKKFWCKKKFKKNKKRKFKKRKKCKRIIRKWRSFRGHRYNHCYKWRWFRFCR